MIAKEVVARLGRRHDKDVFLSEVSICSSCRPGYGRLDAWAMKRSYSSPMSWGYEVKVSRQDFLRDDKWQKYLPVCHQFYFVTPHGLVQPEEMPEGVGLMWASKNARRLLTKRKARTRNITIPQDFWMSVVINRLASGTDDVLDLQDRKDRMEWYRRCLEDRKNRGLLGVAIRSEILRRVEEQERESSALQRSVARVEETIEALNALGLGNVRYMTPESIRNQILEKAGIPDVWRIRNAVESISDWLTEAETALQVREPEQIQTGGHTDGN